MWYKGSKNKIAKYIAPIIKNYLDDLSNKFPNDKVHYIEPFVGGANMIDKVEWDSKYGFDVDKYVIAVHKKAQKEEIIPLNIEKEKYYEFKSKYGNLSDDWEVNHPSNIDYEKHYEVGHYRCFASFHSGGFTSGFGANDYEPRIRNINQQRLNPQYQNIKFNTLKVKDIDLRALQFNKPAQFVIYLDPPYKGTTGYNKLGFSHDELWAKCAEWKKQNPNVIILLSELEAPASFREIWSKEHTHTFNGGITTLEKLFIYEGDK